MGHCNNNRSTRMSIQVSKCRLWISSIQYSGVSQGRMQNLCCCLGPRSGDLIWCWRTPPLDQYPTGNFDGAAGMDQMGFDYGQVLYPQFWFAGGQLAMKAFCLWARGDLARLDHWNKKFTQVPDIAHSYRRSSNISWKHEKNSRATSRIFIFFGRPTVSTPTHA